VAQQRLRTAFASGVGSQVPKVQASHKYHLLSWY